MFLLYLMDEEKQAAIFKNPAFCTYLDEKCANIWAKVFGFLKTGCFFDRSKRTIRDRIHAITTEYTLFLLKGRRRSFEKNRLYYMKRYCSFQGKRAYMRYEKCLTCEQINKTCDGPNLLAMETKELGLFCNEMRKKIPGCTYDKIAADTNLSKSAVYAFLNGLRDDCSLFTARAIAKYIFGDRWDDNACGNLNNSEKAHMEEKIHQLEMEIQWRKEEIEYLSEDNEKLQALVANTNKRNDKSQRFMRGTVIVLGIMCFLMFLLILAAVIIDYLDRTRGYFWLDSLLRRNDIGSFMGSIRHMLAERLSI